MSHWIGLARSVLVFALAGVASTSIVLSHDLGVDGVGLRLGQVVEGGIADILCGHSSQVEPTDANLIYVVCL